jgi:hypothetical protein
LISATSTITSAANITGGNLITANLVQGTTLSATGNIIAGVSVLTDGLVSAAANVIGGNILTGGLISATSDITSAANITGGNVLTGGLVSATANVTGGNVLTGGLISATGAWAEASDSDKETSQEWKNEFLGKGWTIKFVSRRFTAGTDGITPYAQTAYDAGEYTLIEDFAESVALFLIDREKGYIGKNTII